MVISTETLTNEYTNDSLEALVGAHNGTKILLGMGVQLTADEHIQEERVLTIARLLEDSYYNGSLDCTYVLLSGGYTAKSSGHQTADNIEQISEAERAYNSLSTALRHRDLPLEIHPIHLEDFTPNGFATTQSIGKICVPIILDTHPDIDCRKYTRFAKINEYFRRSNTRKRSKFIGRHSCWYN